MEETYRREVAYAPFASQLRFHLLGTRFRGFSGPVGSGKTSAFCQEALKLAYVNAGCLGLIGAPTYRMLADVTGAAFLELLERERIPHCYLKSEKAVLLSEPGSRVIFRTLDEPTRLVGTNLAWFGCDELTYSKEDSWRRLEARLREPRARELAGFAVWTPKGHDWVYRRFIGAERVEGYEAVVATPGENTALPADFYERLKRSYDERFYRQEALGEYLNVFCGAVYYTFDRKESVRNLEYDWRLPLWWSLDFNIDPMSSVICQVADTTTREEAMIGRRSREIRVLDELVLPDSRTTEACAAFFSRIRELPLFSRGSKAIYVYGDASGSSRHTSSLKSDWDLVREFFRRQTDLQAVFRVPDSNPPVRERVTAVNSALRDAAGKRSLFIDPRCKELLMDFEEVAWKRDAAGNALDDISKHDPRRTHVSDAVGYLVHREVRAGESGPRSTVIL